MGIVKTIYISAILVLGLFLTAGGYILQRDRYWRRVWRELGEPQVKSVSELKEFIKRRAHSTPTAKETIWRKR